MTARQLYTLGHRDARRAHTPTPPPFAVDLPELLREVGHAVGSARRAAARTEAIERLTTRPRIPSIAQELRRLDGLMQLPRCPFCDDPLTGPAELEWNVCCLCAGMLIGMSSVSSEVWTSVAWLGFDLFADADLSAALQGQEDPR